MAPSADQILELVAQHAAERHTPPVFDPYDPKVPVSGKLIGAPEIVELVRSSLDGWLTAGAEHTRFERKLARAAGLRHALMVNSGSSANLAAVSALTSPRLGEKALQPGDEVITVAAGFPTTVNPIVQNGLVPVFVDVTLPSYNVDADRLEEALSPRTRAVMIAHTLGNPFDLDAVTALAKKHDLYLIEDCCDAVGATYRNRSVGSFGDVATVSFYPAHHITMGEGGCVLVQKPAMKRLVESFRDWGRDCWCETGKDNTCGKRFDWQLGNLPCGYDHKYTYTHVGYNLKLTDMQAAVGVAQLERLPTFIEARRRNFATLHAGLRELDDVLVLPEATPNSEPSWVGFPILVREDAPFTRDALTRFLESRRIATRLLFGGNLVRQPAYKDVHYRVIGDLANSDRVMHGAFWIGVHPGLTEEMLAYMIESVNAFCRGAVHA